MNETETDGEYINGDYVFVIGSDGKLKSMMFPEDLMETPPKTIRKILKIFGIPNIHMIVEQTLH
jgi:hypothetical protein